MAVLASIVSGGYTATYASSDIGQQEDGFRLRIAYHKEEVKVNGYGDMVIDSFYKGGNCFLSGICIERDKVVKKNAMCVANPYNLGNDGATRGLGFVGVLGRSDFTLTSALTLTAIATLPSASSIATITATNAIIEKELSSEIALSNRASYFSVTFRLYPFRDSGNDMWFQTT